MEKQQKERIEVAYKEIKSIYKRKGLYYTFYTFYRNFTCPIKRIFQLIPSGKSYIDIGCGYGFISIWTALVFPEAEVVGMDIVKSRIEFAKHLSKNIKNLDFQVKDITSEPVDFSQIILLIDLFHHIPFNQQMPFLLKCMNNTPQNGYIIFKDIDRKPRWKFWFNTLQDFIFTRERTYCRDKDEYLSFLQANGFKVEYFDLKKGYAYSHYLIRARKI
jgi:2-polyprenyl-3-methyl-5-hydroxy-6-metoxy-1,4-benzoquinol methylase